MAGVGGPTKDAALTAVHAALSDATAGILAPNTRDKAAAAARVADGGLPAATAKRLELGGAKFDALLKSVSSVRSLPDPVGIVSCATRLDDGLDLYRMSTPIGVIAMVFEARPEAAVQIAALATKSANAVILEGGKEAEASNAILLVAARGQVAQLLSLNAHIDLVIPRGSNALVKYITESTKIPVMGHADALCAVYVDAAADMDKAVATVVDAKTQYPAVWDTEFLELTVALGVVDSLNAAVDHINAHGSHHIDAIVMEDAAAANIFLPHVDSAGVFHIASTRFADGFRYGFGAEVGVSTHRTHACRPVGL
ncbi:hypothetical protein MMPV_002566 [Pyropia vietnamensis]